MAEEKKKTKGKKEEGASKGARDAKAKASASNPPRAMVRYRESSRDVLKKKYGYKNVNQVPKIEKIVLSCSTKDAVVNPKVLDSIAQDFEAICGQKPVISKAKKSIAGFKIRQGLPLGCMVTLRRHRMYEFFDRLTNIALPRVRDFKGLNPDSFDGRGSYSFGLKEQIIFPEIDYDKVDKVRGMNITIVTSAKTNDEARDLLASLGFPFRSNE